MKKFRLKVDTTFDADNLENACMQLIEHFMAVGGLTRNDVEVQAEDDGSFLIHVGSFELKPDEV